MRFSCVRPLSPIAIVGIACGGLFAQPASPSRAAPKTERGLEAAVNWKWQVAPPDKQEWGMELPEELRPKPDGEETAMPEERPETYEVKKGDALVKIARKFDMTVVQLKQFNELTDDRIKIGQILRIPTPGELLTMIPPPPPPPPPAPPPDPAKEAAGKKKPGKSVVFDDPVPAIDPDYEARMELEAVRLQVFLDREMFSPGVIDGKTGGTFQKISEIYQRTHPDAADPTRLKLKAEAAIKEPYVRYTLRAEDYKFIKPAKGEPVVASGKTSPAVKKKAPKPGAPPVPPPSVTINELVAADFLAYTSAWEFVAERFHCDEDFLRHINPHLKETPVVGTEFQVPNVIPFEIEKAFDPPLQPAADPQKPVTAAIVLVSRLEISSDGKLLAVMPLTTARPGLSGRDKWTILDAIPQPRMSTKREPREVAKPKAPAAPGAVPAAEPVIQLSLEKEQYLASGPNNPVGVLWINLAKSGSTEPLPYGLHGTSIPARMKLEGIGGLRLTNWDIARAVRMMPAGTTLQWKAK